MWVDLTPGLTAHTVHVVTDADTASSLGSGDVAVLATPRLLAWFEAATTQALAGRLEPELTTVGAQVELLHLAPSVVGGLISVTATLSAVVGRRLTFDCRAADVTGSAVSTAEVVRVVVVRADFPGGPLDA
jgi:fluoroacetyl-CoA thioesterase